MWLKVEGDNPTGSFKDRGMTVALSVAVGQGAEAVVCASTGNTSASMAAYAARARVKPLVLVPQGKIAAGKLAQAIVHGAQVIMVRGNFDDCLRLSRGLAEHYPVALVNSVNPMRLEGQKTASFEIVDFLGDAPDVHVLPVGNAGNISAYWKGYLEYAEGRPQPRAPRGCSAGRPPARRRWSPATPVADPETVASAIRIGNPASWHLAVGGGRGRPAAASAPSPTSRSSPRSAQLAAARRRLRRAGLGGGRRRAARRRSPRAGTSYAGQRLVVTVTGHGLKDIDTALSTFTDLVDTVVDADVDAAAAGRGAPAAMTTFVSGPVTGLGARDERQPRARLRRARARARPPRHGSPPRSSTARVVQITVAGEGDGQRARSTSGTWCTAPCAPPSSAWAPACRRCGCDCVNVVPHARGLGSSSAAIVAGVCAGPRRWSPAARCCSTTTPSSRWPPTSRATPTTSRRRSTAASPSPTATATGSGRRALAVDPRVHGGGVRAAGRRRDHGGPRAAAGHRAARRRGRATPGGPRCWSPRWARQPELLLAATEDRLHQDYREPAMPGSLALVRALRADGLPAVVSGAGPTVLVLTDARRQQAEVARRAPAGWDALAVPDRPDGAASRSDAAGRRIATGGMSGRGRVRLQPWQPSHVRC